MKILVIGTVIKDQIYLIDGSVSESLGGFIYTLLPLVALSPTDTEIIPLCKIGYDIFDQVSELFKTEYRLTTQGLIKCQQLNNAVKLTYKNEAERNEQSLHPLPPLVFEEIEPFLDADVLVINLISGWEIDLVTLKKIRQNFEKKIFIDLHSSALGRNHDGKRFYRPVNNPEFWFQSADIIQCNENEIEMFNPNQKNIKNILAEYCINQSKILNLTVSANGSTSYIKNGNQISTLQTSARRDLDFIDPTGCGDAFLAGFVLGYIKNRRIEDSLESANLVAALNGTYCGLPDKKSFRDGYARIVKESS